MDPEEIETLRDAVYIVLEEHFNDARRRPFNATRMIRQIVDEGLMPGADMVQLNTSNQLVEDIIAEEVQRRERRGDRDRYVEVERITRLCRWLWRNNADDNA